MEYIRNDSGIFYPPDKIWMPPLIKQENLWGETEYLPVLAPQDDNMLIQRFLPATLSEGMRKVEKQKKSYLGCHLIPRNVMVEGKEEFPCLMQYTGPLPISLSGMDERTPVNSHLCGMHGFCYDNVLSQKFRNFERLIAKAKNFFCMLGMNFTSLLDGRRCEVVEAIRLNRYATLGAQLRGIPTIQTHAICASRFFDIAHDGLAPNCPVAIGNRFEFKDPDLMDLQRVAIEELIKRKNTTVLIVVGFPLGFDPGIPVVRYNCRIQDLRDHVYSRKKQVSACVC